MTSMTLNIDGTTLTLDEAITELRNLAGEIKYRTYNFQNGAGSREFVALQFAMRVLAEKAEVSPARRTDLALSGPLLLALHAVELARVGLVVGHVWSSWSGCGARDSAHRRVASRTTLDQRTGWNVN